MRTSLVLAFSILGFSACTTSPSFQQNATEGFQITDSQYPAMFTVDIRIQNSASPSFRSDYALRAIGETCAKRGFDYFNYAPAGENKWQGYCYKTLSNRSLGLTLTVPKADDAKFIVESLNNKTKTNVHVGDALLKVNSQPITSMAVLKTEVFVAVEAKKSTITLEIERNGETQTVEEPIADVANASLGPTDLEAFRRLIR